MPLNSQTKPVQSTTNYRTQTKQLAKAQFKSNLEVAIIHSQVPQPSSQVRRDPVSRWRPATKKRFGKQMSNRWNLFAFTTDILWQLWLIPPFCHLAASSKVGIPSAAWLLWGIWTLDSFPCKKHFASIIHPCSNTIKPKKTKLNCRPIPKSGLEQAYLLPRSLRKQMIWEQPLLQEHVGVHGELREGPEITLPLLIVLQHEPVSVYGHSWQDEGWRYHQIILFF